jgi:hypothetical protein
VAGLEVDLHHGIAVGLDDDRGLAGDRDQGRVAVGADVERAAAFPVLTSTEVTVPSIVLTT